MGKAAGPRRPLGGAGVAGEVRSSERRPDRCGGDAPARGRETWRVAEELRARLADGTYPVGSLIPPQRELADRFHVSRDTVQRALKELAGEGWIE
ncbi:winged helix-turn-helix domain-containing protein, partial [Kitasatospora indigofera]|uniref:winged helix-turn-helix domain-containing protein n=1 Tax=Kitasatospora indigofera TaxID=67307 RepID=UPI0036C3717D